MTPDSHSLPDRLVCALEDVLLDEERGGLGAEPSRRRVAEVLAHEAGKHEAAELERLRAALAELVRLKDGPRDDAYRAAKDAAWRAAREALNGGEAT